MQQRTPRLLSLVAAATLALALTACPSKSLTGVAGKNGVIATGGTAAVHVAGRAFRLTLGDGKPLTALTIMAGGAVFQTGADGTVGLPDTFLADAKAAGGFVVMAPGYAPRLITLDQLDDQVALQPAQPLGKQEQMPRSGGTLGAPTAGLALQVPDGLLVHPADVTLAGYIPDIPDGAQDQIAQDRKAFLAKVTGSGADCGAPIPCPPVKTGLGLLLTVDGPIIPGPITATYDLDALAHSSNQAQAAAALALQQAFDAIDHSGNAAYRQVLADSYGIRLTGKQLTFAVPIGEQARTQGTVRIDVDGFALLGVRLELTVVSATSGALPTQALLATPQPGVPFTTPSMLPNPGTGLGNLISDTGSSIIANNGGAFAGRVQIPFQETGAKYHVTDYTEYRWDQGLVAILDAKRQPIPLPPGATPDPGAPTPAPELDADGNPIAPAADEPKTIPPVRVTGESKYAFSQLQALPSVVVLEAQLQDYRAYAIAQAPTNGAVVPLDVTAASSGVTAYILDGLKSGWAKESDINFNGYADDIAELKRDMNQDNAEKIVTPARIPVGLTFILDVNPGASQEAQKVFSSHGYKPRCFRSGVGPPPPPPPPSSKPASPAPQGSPAHTTP